MSSVLLACSVFLAEQSYARTLFIDDFETGSRSNEINGYGWGAVDAGAGADAKPQVSKDIAHSGNYSLKFTYGGGPDGDDAWSEQRYQLGENRNEVYIQWYQYFPDGTEGLGAKWRHRQSSGPDNNKFLKLWADKYRGYTVTTGIITYPGGNNGEDLCYISYGTNMRGDVGTGGYPPATKIIPLGRWVKFQYHAKTATSANNDGVIQLWMDDELIIDQQHLDMYPIGGVENFLRHGYIQGWSNSGFDQTTSTYIDDFQISDTYIGGNPPSAPVAE